MKIRPFAVPLIIVLAGSVALIESLKLPFGLVSAPGPGFFPTVLAVLLIVCALAVCWQSVMDTGELLSFSSGRKRTILTVLLLIGFASFIEFLGYLVRYAVEIDGTDILVDDEHYMGRHKYEVGTMLRVALDQDKVRILPN